MKRRCSRGLNTLSHYSIRTRGTSACDYAQIRRRAARLRDAAHERVRCCGRNRTYNTGTGGDIEVPTYALVLVDAFMPKLEASRALLRTIAALCDGILYPKQKQEGLQA